MLGLPRRGLQLGEVVVEPVVAGVDELLVRGEPALERRQRRRFEPVEPVAAGGAHTDEADLGQHLEVLGHLWLGEQSRPTNSPTDASPSTSASRIARRCASAMALNTSVVVAARAMAKSLYSYIGICQARDRQAMTDGGGADATNANSCTARVIAT